MHSFRSRGIGVVVSIGRALARREMLRAKQPSAAMLAARMTRVLLTIEDDTLANARPCPICHASPDQNETQGALAHGAACELDAVLAAAGSRSDAGTESY